MERLKEIEKSLKNILKSGAIGILVFEGRMCPITVWSVTDKHIRVSRVNIVNELFIGAQVSLELCSNQGCLVLQTEVIEIPESPDEGILLRFPDMTSHIFLRQFWRLPVNLPVEIKPHAHPRRLKGIIRNISAGGMLISIEEPLNVGDSVDIFFSLKYPQSGVERHFHLVGSVTHVAVMGAGNQVSLRFVGMDPEDERQINDFVIKTLKASCPRLNIATS